MTAASERLRELLPLPFVAVVVLLLVLIALTPNFLSLGRPTAGSLETEAELIIDRSPDQNFTHFYVEGIGTVRYAAITLSFAHPPPGGPPSSPTFSFSNRSVWNQSIVAEETTAWNPVAVNVSALYIDPSGASAFFVGVFEFNLTSTTVLSESYFPSPASSTTTPIGTLPLTFLLESVPVGSFP
ncbi:MAG: hypothetical protein L3J95_02010 [Thermoplasmata archaeon]|nr:hypothetical protein [Thermoplasmata archaeon]MCI4359186.1 hypothetical protein [Thermoplasmata archaeon]